jgi:hypothetical protein
METEGKKMGEKGFDSYFPFLEYWNDVFEERARIHAEQRDGKGREKDFLKMSLNLVPWVLN